METVEDLTPPAMTNTAPPSAGDDTELVAMLKQQLKDKCTEAASLRQYRDHYQTDQRDYVNRKQEDAVAYMNELSNHPSVEAGMRHYVPSLQTWSQSLASHPSETLEQQMPLALMVDCASADRKRARDVETQLAEQTEMVKQLSEEKDKERSEKEKFQRMHDSMKDLASERLAESEDLMQRLASAQNNQQRWNFANPTSRERVGAALGTSAPRMGGGTAKTAAEAQALAANGIPSNLATGGLTGAERLTEAAPGGMATTVDTASGKARLGARSSFVDPTQTLASFIGTQGGFGGMRIMRSGTQHSILGGASEPPSGGTWSAETMDVAAAIRAASSGSSMTM